MVALAAILRTVTGAASGAFLLVSGRLDAQAAIVYGFIWGTVIGIAAAASLAGTMMEGRRPLPDGRLRASGRDVVLAAIARWSLPAAMVAFVAARGSGILASAFAGAVTASGLVRLWVAAVGAAWERKEEKELLMEAWRFPRPRRIFVGTGSVGTRRSTDRVRPSEPNSGPA